ncbi:Ger(x)C family spore germination protein [Paenibacillus barcinonensis]|uniref:Ger(X)C family spore germination protein n=1 Tax=Paenibacillus barcinonensis TaxID=198119 RepID=A0A2V4VNE7_PAEBA|nr:Ger(x)C family spore germination protein [Paenibacillus barcinonensis]PYE43838.1 spore germination protein KC [Paenibacillus barcinonensis]QKS58428.1 Ger(x)C family spore germination protein [Paenibacillus barcinonensis]
MKKYLLMLLSLVIIMPLLSGCWDRQELNQLGIVLGLGVDKDGDRIKVSAQVVVPNEMSSRSRGGKGTPVTQYQATARTLLEAIQKLTETSPRAIFLSHVRVLVFSEAFAREEGIYDIIEALMREPSARPDYYVMVARRTTASQILDALTPLDNIPAEKLFNSLDISSKNWAPTTTVTTDKLMQYILTPSMSPVITGVEIIGDPQAAGESKNIESVKSLATLHFSGLSVFKKDKLVGWLDENHSKGYNYIRDNVKSTIGAVNCPAGGYVTLKTLRTSTKHSVKMVNGEPQIRIKVENVSTVGSVECDMEIGSMEAIKEMEQNAQDRIVELMKQTVSLVRSKYHVDIFGFGQDIYHKYPKLYKKEEDTWDKYFMNLDIKYEANVQIRRIGTLDNSFNKKAKE